MRSIRTKLLREAVEALRDDNYQESYSGPQFPSSFLIALRESLKVGWTCEQLTSFLLLITGLHKTIAQFDGEELVRRSEYILRTMKGDLDSLEKQKELAKILQSKQKKKSRFGRK